jgi:hypothetical protein
MLTAIALTVWLIIYTVLYYRLMNQIYTEGTCDKPTLAMFLITLGIVLALTYNHFTPGGAS